MTQEHKRRAMALIEVEPHAYNEIPDHGTYAGELYLRATPLRLVASELLEALEIASQWGHGQPPPCSEEEFVEKVLAKARGA